MDLAEEFWAQRDKYINMKLRGQQAVIFNVHIMQYLIIRDLTKADCKEEYRMKHIVVDLEMNKYFYFQSFF